MPQFQTRHYEKVIAHEEKLAAHAGSEPIASAHRHVARLYRSELARLAHRQTSNVAEMLADTW